MDLVDPGWIDAPVSSGKVVWVAKEVDHDDDSARVRAAHPGTGRAHPRWERAERGEDISARPEIPKTGHHPS